MFRIRVFLTSVGKVEGDRFCDCPLLVVKRTTYCSKDKAKTMCGKTYLYHGDKGNIVFSIMI